jgi:hypothetical protein
LVDADEAHAHVGADDTVLDPTWSQIADLLDALLPPQLGVIVVSRRPPPACVGRRQVHAIQVLLDDGRPVDDKGHPVIFAVRDAVRVEPRYLVVPRLPGDETATVVSTVLRARYRVLVHHAALCTVFDSQHRG